MIHKRKVKWTFVKYCVTSIIFSKQIADQVGAMALSETPANAKSSTKRKVNHWKIFDEMYDEDHSINLLKYWIQVLVNPCIVVLKLKVRRSQSPPTKKFE